MSLTDSEESRSPREAEDDNKRADAWRGAGVGRRAVPRVAKDEESADDWELHHCS
jgi:hypothetical protein